MEINQKIAIAKPPEQVWALLSDVEMVAQCVPGLELTGQSEDGTYRARFTLKVGPLSAKLDGEGTLTCDEKTRSATIAGKGVDKRGGSRAKGTMRYHVAGTDFGAEIDVNADFTLSGPLAQIGRTSIIDDIAQTLTRQFADNLEKQLADVPDQDLQTPSTKAGGKKQFDAGRAISGAISRRVTAGLKRPFNSK